MAIELFDFVGLFRDSLDGLQRALHSVQPILAVCLLKSDDVTVNRYERPSFSLLFLIYITGKPSNIKRFFLMPFGSLPALNSGCTGFQTII